MSLPGFSTINLRGHDVTAATEYQPITPHGDSGFITASVVDPLGNVLGVMNNPHYLDVLASFRQG